MENKHDLSLNTRDTVINLVHQLEQASVNSKLYSMSSFPNKNLEHYKGAYILVKDTLKYVNSLGNYEDVQLDDVALFFQNIPSIKNKTELLLSEDEVRCLITANGGHDPFISRCQSIKHWLSKYPKLSNLTIDFKEAEKTSRQEQLEKYPDLECFDRSETSRYIVRNLFQVLTRFLSANVVWGLLPVSTDENKYSAWSEQQAKTVYELLKWIICLDDFQIEQFSSDMDNCLHLFAHYGFHELLIIAVNRAFREQKLDSMSRQQNTFSETPIIVAEKRYKHLLEDKQFSKAEKAKRSWYLLILACKYPDTLFAGKLAINWNDVAENEKMLEQILSHEKPHSEIVTKIENVEIKIAKKDRDDIVIEITAPKTHFSLLKKLEDALPQTFDDRLYSVTFGRKSNSTFSVLTITAIKQLRFLDSLFQLLMIADLVYKHLHVDICAAIQNGFYTYDVKLMEIKGSTLPSFKHTNPTLIKLNDTFNDKISYYIHGHPEDSEYDAFQLTPLKNIPALNELDFSSNAVIKISLEVNAPIYEEIKKKKGHCPSLSLIPFVLKDRSSAEPFINIFNKEKVARFLKGQQALYVKANAIELLEKIASLLKAAAFYPWFIARDNNVLVIISSQEKFQNLLALINKEINLFKETKSVDKEVELLDQNIEALFEDFMTLCDYIKRFPEKIDDLKKLYLTWEQFFFIYTHKAEKLGIINNHFLKNCEANTVSAQASHQDNRLSIIKERIHRMIQTFTTNTQLQKFRKTFCCSSPPRDFRIKTPTKKVLRLLDFGSILKDVPLETIEICYLPNEAERVFPQFQELFKAFNPNISVRMLEENNLKIISISGEAIDQFKQDENGQISFRILVNSSKNDNFDVLIAKIHQLLGISWDWDDSVSFQKTEDNQKRTYFVITVKPNQQLADTLSIQEKPSGCLVM